MQRAPEPSGSSVVPALASAAPVVTRADFATPIAQRVIGSAPPIVQRAPDLGSDARQAEPEPGSTIPAFTSGTFTSGPVTNEPKVAQRLITLAPPRPSAPSPPPTRPAAALPVVVARTAQSDPTLTPTPTPSQPVARAEEPATTQAPPDPVVQRAEAPQAGPAPQQGQSADELLRKLYDPLLRRLKADLWLDRERRGALTDL